MSEQADHGSRTIGNGGEKKVLLDAEPTSTADGGPDTVDLIELLDNKVGTYIIKIGTHHTQDTYTSNRHYSAIFLMLVEQDGGNENPVQITYREILSPSGGGAGGTFNVDVGNQTAEVTYGYGDYNYRPNIYITAEKLGPGSTFA